ncbi:MAG: hypothetical protein GX580_06390 [Candidatus Hydrogenedens sp.]|nr:hypothetical protein [Candidatus Hydrogenedentota bacterium]NLF57249.1 hypothetical protein [Candidatus Hydrogenedens sp.]
MKQFVTLFLLALLLTPAAMPLTVHVEAEEEVYQFTNPNNGSGPMWSHGNTGIALLNGTPWVSQMETGEGVPPLCNTRWRLLERTENGWQMRAESETFNQREPCPLAAANGALFLSVNDSTQPLGTQYGECLPHVLRFTPDGDGLVKTALLPQWTEKHYFTDHSYRGYAADPEAGRLLLLNIDAKTSVQHACILSESGETRAVGSVSFPVRACYPHVSLRGNAAHVLAVGDIVEPVKEWREYKFAQTGQNWDYVFRILYYTATPDLAAAPFCVPVEIANVDGTAGAVSGHDLWIAPDGAAHILYTERKTASALMRDKFFPGNSILNRLMLAVVRDGAVVSRRVLVEGAENAEPGAARFHVAADGAVFALLHMSGGDGGAKVMRVFPSEEDAAPVSVPLLEPLSSFSLAGVRAGNPPSDTIHAIGPIGNSMRYARLTLER